MFGRADIGGGLARVTNGCLAVGFRVRERRQSGWKVTGNAGRVAGSGSPVSGGKLRFRFIVQIDFAGKGIDLLQVESDAFVDLCIDPRREQFAGPARLFAHWL
jgi:hypothetical protein